MIAKRLLFLFCITFVSSAIQAQNIRIDLGPDEIPSNRLFPITVVIDNARLQGYDEFPDIEGFTKRNMSSGSSTQIINGQLSFSTSFTQNYLPLKEGTFTIPPFEMEVNGQKVRSPGKTVRVVAPLQTRRNTSPWGRDPFEDFFGRSEPTEFIEVEDEAFLAFTVDKKEAYVGEGINTSLAFYVADANRAPMNFFDLNNQVTEILKKLRPSNCWEENFNLERVEEEHISIKGKGYRRFKLYEGTFFPLNDEDLLFPSVGLKMVKYKVAKNPGYFGRQRQEDFKFFYSKPQRIKVKELPPHPLKDLVSVGQFELKEKLSTPALNTGQSFSYDFTVRGRGNISAVTEPLLPDTEDFDFYSPNVRQNIIHSNNQTRGTKTFQYFAVPNEPGEFDLGDYFQWVYFNTATEAYDTLIAQSSIMIAGESRKNETILSSDLGSFYDQTHAATNLLQAKNRSNWLQWLSNGLVVLLLGATIALLFKK